MGDRAPEGRSRFVLVAGTGTGIGKTYVTARVAAAVRERGVAVAARKPVQSFAPEDDSPTDADVLAAATGEQPHAVCPEHRWLPRAMAPPMAAEALGLDPFTIDELAAEVGQAVPGDAVVLVESVGGVRSPLADDGDTVALAGALQPALVVLVADAELGTINLVRLSVDALAPYRVAVYLNRYDASDELHTRNRDWLVTRHDLEVVTDPEAVANLVGES
jgi:dethiobiotin synthetase